MGRDINTFLRGNTFDPRFGLNVMQGPPGTTAYEYAVSKGYPYDEDQFATDLAELRTMAEQAVASAQTASEASGFAQAAQTLAESAATAADEAKRAAQGYADDAASASAYAEAARLSAETAEAAREEILEVSGGILTLLEQI